MTRRQERLKELHRLQKQADAIRHDLGISAPGEILFCSPLCALEDEVVVVEADGLGGATTSVVEGNYPVDYITEFEKHFSSEEAAIKSAERLIEGSESIQTALS